MLYDQGSAQKIFSGSDPELTGTHFYYTNFNLKRIFCSKTFNAVEKKLFVINLFNIFKNEP